MKKVLLIMLSMMVSLFAMSRGTDISQKVSSGDSVTVHMNFESSTQQVVTQMLENNNKVTTVLSESMAQLTTAIQEGIEQTKLTKMDVVAKQMGVDRYVLQKSFKRNNTIILICLLPSLAFIFYAMYSFLIQKGLDIKHLLAGTAVMALYSLLGSGVLYVILSLIFNSQYFMIRNLLSALF